KKKERDRREKLLRNLVFKQTLTNKKILRMIGQSLFFMQRTNMNKLLRKSKLFNLFPPAIACMESITPHVNRPIKRNHVWSHQRSKERLRIGFFPGCVMDTFFARVNDLSIKLLEAAGCDVIAIKDQGCCGALQQHAGEKEI